MKALSLLSLLIFSNFCFAYIPEYSLITTRVSENHGHGAYLVEQDVTIKKEAESFTVRETWIILNENNMRVTFEGRGPLKGLVQGSIIYDNNTRSFIDASQTSKTSQRLGDDWLEPLFHFRFSKYFRSRLVNLKVAPADSLKDRPPLKSDGEPKYEAPSFIRLSRVGGAVAWAIGTSPKEGSGPTLWIDQDQFNIRKYKSANNVVLKADAYAKVDENFWYPREREYQFNNYQIKIQTVQVKPLGKLKPDDSRLKTASLVPAKDSLKLPDVDGLKDFFLRFR